MPIPVVLSRFCNAVSAVRAKVSRKAIFRSTLALVVLSTLVIAGEAGFRARLGSPASRVETAVYSRPAPWGGRGSSTSIPIGTPHGGLTESRNPVSLDDIPGDLVNAVLAVEDQRFYDHWGLDLTRIGGALVANLKAGRISQGGSTITQQLAKNLYLSHNRTPLRKLREAAMAAVLEARSTKPQILEAYLNEIYLGQDGRRAIHGVGAASRYYFGKDASRLTLAESALLAGMIQAPNRYNPVRNVEAARQRRNLVLGLMADQSRIPSKTAERAARSSVSARAHPAPSLDARYFLDVATAGLPRRPPSRGAQVYTTLDPALQRAADRAVSDGLSRIRGSDAQVALVAIDPRTGDVLALVGGRDYGASQFNRATVAKRQPGSAFKPIALLAALSPSEGRSGVPLFTLATRVADAPFSIRSGGIEWSPVNYDRSFRGEVTVREAIELSLNVPVARIGLEVGPDRIAETGRRLGITSPLHAVPSLALGSSEVSLLELVRAYGVFAAGGRLAPTRMVMGRGRSQDGGIEAVTSAEAREVVSPAAAYLVTSALQGVIARGTGRSLGASRQFGAIAGKTGTTNDWRDAWFVAYTPSLVVGVWVGYDDGRSLGLSGADAALPIVSRFLERVEPADRWADFPVPDGIETAQVSQPTSEVGWWGGEVCGRQEVFLEGTAPQNSCRGYIAADWIGERLRDLDWDRERMEQAQRALSRYFERLLERIEEQRGEDRPRRRGRDRP